MYQSLLHVVPEPGECVLVHRKGARIGVLQPGQRHLKRLGDRFTVLSTRTRSLALATQEVMAADALAVRVSAVVRWRMSDAVAFTEVDEAPDQALYLATQLAVRDLVAEVESTELPQRVRTEPALGGRLTAQVQQAVATLGIEVLEVVLRDIVLPAEVRRAALDLATAKARGLAQLEEARARTAALRAMANGAKLLDDHPALAHLQLVEAAGVGARIVLNMGAAPGVLNDVDAAPHP